MKKAFTLTEIVIVLVILGALALVLVPTMMNMVPDDHNVKYKKAFYTVQEIVNDMINDANTCPGYDAENDEDYSNNPLKYCVNGSSVRNLRKEFARRLNTSNDDENAVDIPTTNGMRWNIPDSDLDSDFDSATIKVSFDDKAPTGSDSADNGICSINVYSTGKVQPTGSCENLLTKAVNE